MQDTQFSLMIIVVYFDQLQLYMFVQMIFVLADTIMRNTMRHPSNIPKGNLVFVRPYVVVKLVYRVTIDDHVMGDTFGSSMDCVEVGFGNGDLHFL
jgi:hypothetical protein